jgi:guanine deaminase
MQHDNVYIDVACDLALCNVIKGGKPLGAIVVDSASGEIISKATECVSRTNDPTNAAGVIAVRRACDERGTWCLTGCVLYSSSEPCAMCEGAARWAQLDRVVFCTTTRQLHEGGLGEKWDIDIDHCASPNGENAMRMWLMRK